MSNTIARRDFGLQLGSLLVFSIVIGLFCWISFDIIMQGSQNLGIDFLLNSPENAGREGGIRPIITSTVLILLVCLSVSFPIAFSSALVLSGKIWPEKKTFRIANASIGVLAGVPSIVYGLFGNVFFCQYLGLGYSLLSGGLTLACMILPLSIKLLEDCIRTVPNEYILAAKSLNLSASSSIRQVIVPAIAPQITAAFILSIGRSLAETAALLFTSGYVMRDPESLLDSGRTLSIHIFDLSMNVTGANQNTYSTACVLLIFLFIINFCGHSANKLWRRFNYGD